METHRRLYTCAYYILCTIFYLINTSHLSIQEELVASATFRYITDAITPAEALTMLKEKEAGKKEREAIVRELGYVNNDLISQLLVYPLSDTLPTSPLLDGSATLMKRSLASQKRPSPQDSTISR